MAAEETGPPPHADQAPYVLDETGDFAVVFKPPRMHCAPLGAGSGGTLLDWYAEVFPPVLGLCGRKEAEGGLLHRLDFETHGLVLFAKNQKSMDSLLAQQTEGGFVKEYAAVCRKAGPLPAFPPAGFSADEAIAQGSFAVESRFRPFGPGRKQVRPVVANGMGKTAKGADGLYRTEILAVSPAEPCGEVPPGVFRFAARLRRGFRHQVRCHLAWIGCPILNDPLYGGEAARGVLALRADGLFFCDPGSGRRLKYRIPPLE